MDKGEIFISKRKAGVNYFNPYKIYEDGRCEFYITNKKDEIFVAKIDRDVLDRLIQFNRSWYAKWAGWAYYVCCCEYLSYNNGSPKYKIHYLHRWIVDAQEDEYVDHIEQTETLDNRRSNLRVTTNSKNNQSRKGKNVNNKSGYRNVFWNSGIEKWTVTLMVKYERIHIGDFDDVHEAGKAAEIARHEFYGEFAGVS